MFQSGGNKLELKSNIEGLLYLIVQDNIIVYLFVSWYSHSTEININMVYFIFLVQLYDGQCNKTDFHRVLRLIKKSKKGGKIGWDKKKK
jgi:hypothetical protein